MEKVIIIGSGPAGLTAALYAARAELSPLVLTGMSPGGQISLTGAVENYPGFPGGITGPELAEAMQKQAEHFGARMEMDQVTEVDLKRRPFVVRTMGEQEYEAQTLIIATGATPRKLGVPGEEEFTGRGVSYCATCDGYFFRGQDVVVVGGGDSALEEGTFLTRYANKVTIVHRRDQLRAGPLLQRRAFDNPKVDFIWNTLVTRINGNGTVESVGLRNVQTGEEKEFPTNGVFVFIGHDPNTHLFRGQLDLDEQGYIRSDGRAGTSVEGVFVAGEAADPEFRQIISSAGMGSMAALRAQRYLESLGDRDGA